ncbi:MAG: hypothetical protein M3441_01450 [Chloroflexota bacterium]|nr:hypothetical protein [Chloroflexota bacterium]MDQ5852679.1 hypothetical protein [Chloroflexota bacterium]
MNTRNLIRWAGVSAIVAGIFYVIVGLFHPLETLLTVTTTQWAIVHALAVALSFFGVLGITGIYARQAKEAGWLGLTGYLLLCLWLVLLVPFTFTEVFILPQLATQSPVFVESFLGMFNRHPGEMDLGPIKMIWDLDGVAYMLGGLLFGIATFRAGILSRWAGALLAIGSAASPVAELLPLEYKAFVAVPVGLALAWLGYAVWSERREHAAQLVPGKVNPQLSPTVAR